VDQEIVPLLPSVLSPSPWRPGLLVLDRRSETHLLPSPPFLEKYFERGVSFFQELPPQAKGRGSFRPHSFFFLPVRSLVSSIVVVLEACVSNSLLSSPNSFRQAFLLSVTSRD